MLPPPGRVKSRTVTAAGAALDFGWEPKRALTLKAARRRSRLVAALRRFFVAGAGASFAAVFVFMALHAVEGGFNAGQYAAAEPLRMINPRFVGRTENGGPYQLSAEVAERAVGDLSPNPAAQHQSTVAVTQFITSSLEHAKWSGAGDPTSAGQSASVEVYNHVWGGEPVAVSV